MIDQCATVTGMTKRLSKYVYQCPMMTCRKVFSTSVAPSDYPTCTGENKAHYKLMDFIEEKSRAVPKHVDPKHKNRKEGRWL